MTAPLLIEALTKEYRRDGQRHRALDGASLSVEAGQIVALLGNNGAGKSTLMNIVAGLLSADGGSVTVCGATLDKKSTSSESALGYAPQDEALYPTLTVAQNLRYFGRLSGLRGDALETRVHEVSRQLMLSDLRDRRAALMSGGERRRLHTALALMHRPSILMLDEPTVGVDLAARDQLLDFVRRTAAGCAAILYSTHQLHEVEALHAHVVIIDSGKVLASGPVATLVKRYSPPTCELQFDRSEIQLPDDLLAAVDEAGFTAAGQYRVVVRLASEGVAVSSILDHLGEDARRSLVGAMVVAPGLEAAYQRLMRSGATPSGSSS